MSDTTGNPAAKTDQRATGQRAPSPRGDGVDVGQALRVAYQEAIEEDVPDELLELLGKLE